MSIEDGIEGSTENSWKKPYKIIEDQKAQTRLRIA